MATITWGTCGCCERLFASTGTTAPARCAMCEHRDGLCQHNLFERVARGDENRAHSSKPCRGVGCEWVVLEGGEVRRERA